MPVTGLFISTNGNVVKASFDGLTDMQRAVGGLIQPIDFVIEGELVSLYVDEEGRCVHEDYQIPNRLASFLVQQPVIGDAFLIGDVDEEGESLSLPDSLRDKILHTLKTVMP